MTVDQLLDSMPSRELTEWMAYEYHAGPLGTEWIGEVLAGIHEQIQFLNYMFSQSKFTDKQHKKGPAPKPEEYPRPQEVFRGPRKNWPKLKEEDGEG